MQIYKNFLKKQKKNKKRITIRIDYPFLLEIYDTLNIMSVC